MIRAAAAMVLAVAGLTPAPTRDRGIDAMLADRIAGKPQHCVNAAELGNATPVDAHNLLYRSWPRRWWRNTPLATCPALEHDPILIVEIHGGQLCSGDLVRTLDRGSTIPGPACILGDFVPYEKPAR